ncbi:MAG: hypothetical protein COB15_06655 [Flavobacteriales bacterium]|nr:MAG: hypothetical protein COB15_06655 [Flavobacteriales bacterium]
MDKITELKNLKLLLDEGAITKNEFESLKSEILNKEVVEKPIKEVILEQPKETVKKVKGAINISFEGQYFLFDTKTKIFIDGVEHSSHSTKSGFSVDIPIESDIMNIKVSLGGVKSTTYDLTELDLFKKYYLRLSYDTTWGKYSKKINFSENG